MWTKTADEAPAAPEQLNDIDIGFKVMIEDILSRGISEEEAKAILKDSTALSDLNDLLDDSYRAWLDNLEQYKG